MSSVIATDEFPEVCSLDIPKSDRPRLIDVPDFKRLLLSIWAQYWEEEPDTLPASIMERLLPSKQGDTPDYKRKRYFAKGLHHTSGRCFFITEKGYAGDCSLGAEAVILSSLCQAVDCLICSGREKNQVIWISGSMSVIVLPVSGWMEAWLKSYKILYSLMSCSFWYRSAWRIIALWLNTRAERNMIAA